MQSHANEDTLWIVTNGSNLARTSRTPWILSRDRHQLVATNVARTSRTPWILSRDTYRGALLDAWELEMEIENNLGRFEIMRTWSL
jgi:hypothetical protein